LHMLRCKALHSDRHAQACYTTLLFQAAQGSTMTVQSCCTI